MNDTDLHTISKGLRVLLLGHTRLTTWANIYQAKKVNLEGLELVLGSSSMAQIKTAIDELTLDMEAVADSLPQLTGKVGVPNSNELTVLQERPGQILEVVQNVLQQTLLVITNIEAVKQPDGTWATVLDDEGTLQNSADTLATVRDAMKFYVGTQKLKVKAA